MPDHPIVYESSFAVAFTDHPDHLASARDLSHDTVIANTGDDRLSGVSWSYHPALAVTAGLADIGDITLPPAIVEICRVYPNGVLVIATVTVKP